MKEQCELTGVSKGLIYYRPRSEKEENVELINQINEENGTECIVSETEYQ